MEFKELKLNNNILKAVALEGYMNPSPIQEKSIPAILEGRDILGCAQTGTGKTAAFAMPILQLLSQKEHIYPRKIKALILTPTRELAIQIYESFRSYGRFLKLKSGVIMGGVSQNSQVEMIKRGLDILIATPGRLLDLINQKYIDIKAIEFFVLDEADRMLDMGFIHDVRKIIGIIPKKRQTLFFTATMPDEVLKLTTLLLDNPINVSVTPASSTVDAIKQTIYFTDKSKKSDLLLWIIKNDKSMVSTLIFTRTKHGANKVSEFLSKNGITSAAIHGNKSQNARQKALEDFKKGICKTLVATDIAARGLDISDLSHVINYELPEVPETYVHRIGRTGRAGKTGESISFCEINEMDMLKNIEKLIKKNIQIIEGHPYAMKVMEKSPVKQRNQRSSQETSKKTNNKVQKKSK